ncbi:unnamed protein product [Boreogadus saida]
MWSVKGFVRIVWVPSVWTPSASSANLLAHLEMIHHRSLKDHNVSPHFHKHTVVFIADGPNAVMLHLQPSLGNIKTASENTNTEPSSLGYNTELLITPTPMPSLHLEPARVSDRSPAPDSTNPSSSASEPFPTSPSKSTSTPRTTFHPERSENSRTSSDSRSSLSQPPQQQQTPAPPVTHGGSGGGGCGDREALVSGLTCRRCSKEPPSPTSLPWSGFSTGLGDSDGPSTLGSRQLAVVAMVPGSIVVSWYDRGLCCRRQRSGAGSAAGGRCHGDRIRQMWAEMSGADGGVSPPFYRGGAAGYIPRLLGRRPPPTTPTPGASTPADCTTSPNSSVTRSHPPGCNPPHQTSPLTKASRPGEGGGDRMAAMATALLVFCLLVLALLLFLAVLFCYRAGRRRKSRCGSRVVAKFPAGAAAVVPERGPQGSAPRAPPGCCTKTDLNSPRGRCGSVWRRAARALIRVGRIKCKW